MTLYSKDFRTVSEEIKDSFRRMTIEDANYILALKSFFPWAKYVARDSDEELFIYEEKPVFRNDRGQWMTQSSTIIRIDKGNFSFIKKETCLKLSNS